MKQSTRLQRLREACKPLGLWVDTWSPGDGMTRYRFFEEPGNTYFGPENGIFTAKGYKEAVAYAKGAGATFSLDIKQNCTD